jgi:hypothetical protein
MVHADPRRRSATSPEIPVEPGGSVSKVKFVAVALAMAVLLVSGANVVSYAATGHPLVLGATNRTSKATTIVRTSAGPVLTIHSKRRTNAPFRVNGHGLVTHLNAAMVDGKSAAALGDHTYVLDVSGQLSDLTPTLQLPVIPGRNYIVTYSITTDAIGTADQPTNNFCFFTNVIDSSKTALSSNENYGTVNPTMSASGVLAGKPHDWEIHCASTTGWAAVPGMAQLSLTRISKLTAIGAGKAGRDR